MEAALFFGIAALGSWALKRRSAYHLSDEQVAYYHEHGYVFAPGMFTQAEVEVLRAALEADGLTTRKAMAMEDGTGRKSNLTLWNNVNVNTTYGAIAASKRMNDAVTRLMPRGAAAPYHFHTKLMLKEPRTGGSWVVHQDFGYWFAQSAVLDPNRLMSVFVAIDKADAENGCLQVLDGSHKIGRLPHGTEGEQAGADADAVEQAKARFKTVFCDMAPGTVLFTHSNLLHWSGANDSDRWRRVLIVAFNTCDNPPKADSISPQPSVMPVVPDERVLELGPVGNSSLSEAEAAVLSFLTHEANVKSFEHVKGAAYQ